MAPELPQLGTKEIIDGSPSDDETQSYNIVDGGGYPVLTFDADEYRECVQDMGLTKEQEDELLEALWSIVVQFVNMGFGIEPVQRALLDAPPLETSVTGCATELVEEEG